MRLTVSTIKGDICFVDVPGDMELENLKALVSVELPAIGAMGGQFHLVWNDTPLKDMKKTLSAYGITNGEMLLAQQTSNRAAPRENPSTANPFEIDFSSIRVPGSSRSPVRPQAPSNPSGQNPESIESIRQTLLRSREQLGVLRYQNPTLAEAVNDPVKFKQVLEQQRQRAVEMVSLGMADEFDVDAQRRIADAIRQSNIDHSMETAMEYMPESFGQVVMLYISCEVNGQSVKAFVDSGAQMTIMSAACARRCNIERLIDTRWAGIAKGVGTQKIVGRVHLGQLKISGTFLQTSFTILEEQEMDLLLGLDMLRRHQCIIDLGRNCLVIGSNKTETAFLPEAELPSYARLSALGAAGETSSRTAANIPEEKIRILMEQGFSRDDARSELQATNGDVDSALAALLSRRDIQ